MTQERNDQIVIREVTREILVTPEQLLEFEIKTKLDPGEPEQGDATSLPVGLLQRVNDFATSLGGPNFLGDPAAKIAAELPKALEREQAASESADGPNDSSEEDLA